MIDQLEWHQLNWVHPVREADLSNLLKRLASDRSRRPVVFEVRARGGRVRYLFAATEKEAARLSRLFEQLMPGTTLSVLTAERAEIVRGARLEVRQPSMSLDTAGPAASTRLLLEALAAARSTSEEIAMQIVLGAGTVPTQTSPRLDEPNVFWLDLLLRGNRPALPATRANIQSKQGQFGFRTIVRVGASADSEAQRRALMLGVQSALQTLRVAGNGLRLVRDFDGALQHARIPLGWPTRLSVEETSLLLAPPVGKEALPGLPSPHPKLLSPAKDYREPTDFFAVSAAPGTCLKLGSTIEDRLQHTVMTGPTGSGKSSAMLHLILADASAGRSLVVLDPKADLVSDVLARLPEHRLDDVVVIDPTDANPVGLNPLIAAGSSAELTADGILSIFKELFASSFGPRTTDIMHAALLTLAYHGRASLVWLPRLLTDQPFRRSLTSTLDDPIALEPFWAQFEALSPAQQAQVIAPAMSRLRQLLLRPSLRAVLGQVEPRFELSDIFSKPRIVLVALNKGVLGPEAAKLLGSLIVSQLWQLTLARATTPQAQREPVSIYIDEMQDFLHLPTDLADALSQSRSLGVAWHLAHQYRGQVSREMLAAIDANARNKVVFGVDSTDAAAFAKQAPELEAIDFQSLRRFEVYARFINGGQQTGWISGRTLTPPRAARHAWELQVRSQSRYGRKPELRETSAAGIDMPAVEPEQLGRKPRRP